MGNIMKMLAAVFFAAVLVGNATDYKTDTEFAKMQEGRTEIGSMHGTVAVSSANEVYINVEGTAHQRFAVLGPNPGLQVYSVDGKYLRNVPNAPYDLHGFIIHKEPAGEFIYASRLAMDLTPEGLAKVQEELNETDQIFLGLVKKYRPNADMEQISTAGHWLAQQSVDKHLGPHKTKSTWETDAGQSRDHEQRRQ